MNRLKSAMLQPECTNARLKRNNENLVAILQESIVKNCVIYNFELWCLNDLAAYEEDWEYETRSFTLILVKSAGSSISER